MTPQRTMYSDVIERKKELGRRSGYHWSCGWEAVRFVKRKMKIGADDSVGNVYSKLLDGVWVKSCVTDMRDQVEKTVKKKQKEKMKAGYHRDRIGAGGDICWKIRIEAEAKHAIQFGCGNCGEQASLAFVHMRDTGVYPLDYIELRNGDHSFVVIGRTEESRVEVASHWGGGAAICDPWSSAVYTVTEFREKYPGPYVSHYRYDKKS